MTEKTYPASEDDQGNRLSEPSGSYTAASRISLSELNMSAETFAACIKRAEENFSQGRCFTSTELRRRINEERGWEG